MGHLNKIMHTKTSLKCHSILRRASTIDHNGPLYSPYQILECSLIWSSSFVGMHPHLVLTNFWKATSCGPDREQECSLIQSPRYAVIDFEEKTIEIITREILKVFQRIISSECGIYHDRDRCRQFPLCLLYEYSFG